LIAYVALQDRPVHRGRLAGSLWLDKSDARASANLRSALWRMHNQGVDVMEVDGSCLRLREHVDVDLPAATAWALRIIDGRAVSADLDRVPRLGDLLPDWYDDWARIERERLDQLRLHALEDICRGLLDTGRVARAIDAALALVNADPLRESAHKLLIEAQLKEGNWVEAICSGRRYVDTMLDQLGLDVSDRLRSFLPHPVAAQVCGFNGREPSPPHGRRRREVWDR
jgi:DNA-binding SARP family transcriptional activator